MSSFAGYNLRYVSHKNFICSALSQQVCKNTPKNIKNTLSPFPPLPLKKGPQSYEGMGKTETQATSTGKITQRGFQLGNFFYLYASSCAFYLDIASKKQFIDLVCKMSKHLKSEAKHGSNSTRKERKGKEW